MAPATDALLPSATEVEIDPRNLKIQFHHIHIYADSLLPLAEYKRIERQLNALAERGSFDPFSGQTRFLSTEALLARLEEGTKAWNELVDPADRRAVNDYVSTGQDIVEQMIVGLGWRVTAEHVGHATRSVLVTSADPCGVKFCVTCVLPGSGSGDEEPYDHFKRAHVERFLAAHGGRAGVAVLGFEIVEEGGVEAILQRYRKAHSALLVRNLASSASDGPGARGKRHRTDLSFEYTDTRTVHPATSSHPEISTTVELGRMRIGEVFAYYAKGAGVADKGTVLRFVERVGNFVSRPGFSNPEGVLPGLEDVAPVFDGTSIPAYADHWVSNVFDREGFLQTLEDTLGFTPKVDFNAGVVAAGEARIESTVTGNTSRKLARTGAEALVNQSQVYLPINNALSAVGHVHGFLEEVGQGIQHLASRVSNLKALIERVNNYRQITGRGFTFLNIPRSYYGRLDLLLLSKHTSCSSELQVAVCTALVAAGFLSKTGILELDASDSNLSAAVASAELPAALAKERDAKLGEILKAVKMSRYSNLYSLLRDHLNEEEYLQIVRNKILVDIQGSDILYQIFTSSILQRKAGEEAPFLEFIERVCAEARCKDPHEVCSKPIKPGCGGFGIRNFLTLFLSIEVSKAMRELSLAEDKNDDVARALANKKIALFTEQLDVSNPILTDISDAMTIEGECLAELAAATDPIQKAKLEAKAEEMRTKKEAGNARLQEVSARYAALMKALRC